MKKPLPQLENFERTRDSLREALQPLRTARFLGSEPVPNQLEYSVYPKPYGATTGQLSFGGELCLNYEKLSVGYFKDGKKLFSVSLEGNTNQSLFDKVFGEFEKFDLLTDPDSRRDIAHHREDKLSESKELAADLGKAKEYAEAQYRVFGAMSNCRSRLLGIQTPIVLWPHGFDLSFIWFVEGIDEKKDPHIHFGFSPGFEKQRPYLYFYAWPVPDGLIGSELPRNGKWTRQWSTPGGSFEYDEFSDDPDPEEAISDVLFKSFSLASGMMKESKGSK